MKKFVYAILAIALCFGQSSLFAQKDYDQYLLPHPDDLSSLFIGSLTETAIYYGAKPNNSNNKPVLVFVHGFGDLANSWFLPGNDIYDVAYDDRYRTAFIATTRGGGMWVNGALLADMLEEITDYYGVNDVVIVAHSNGGKASEVAMFHENKSHLVNRVISLGTPFKGTPIADLSETPALGWLLDFIGLGGGTATSTTYYMEGVARPILDGSPNNQPNKFINFGAWGYDNGTTLAAPLMFVGGTYLNLAGAGSSTGGNDGVTPYYSSSRPGGSPQWPGYCWWWWCNNESQYDHADITHDYVVWDEIKPFFTGNLNNFLPNRSEEEEQVFNTERNKTLASNFEVLSTMDGYAEHFTVNKNTGVVSINVWHPETEDDFIILDENANPVSYNIQKNKGHHKGMNSTIALEDLKAGTYSIQSDAAEFGAVVAYENGGRLLFDNSNMQYTEGERITLAAKIEGANKDASIRAVLVQTNDLMGEAVDKEVMILELEAQENGNYTYTLPNGLKDGVYNLTLNAVGETFRRNLISGFAVTPSAVVLDTAKDLKLALQSYPNPVVEHTTIEFEVMESATTKLSLYNAYGHLIKTDIFNNLSIGQHQILWDMKELANGTYFLEVTNGAHRATRSLVKLNTK